MFLIVMWNHLTIPPVTTQSINSDVLDHFNKTWKLNYNLAKIISIDESVVGFKSRHMLVKYIRIKKHHQWDPKEYNLCDAATGYCYNIKYNARSGNASKDGQPFDVWVELMAGPHHLVVGNYYTSVRLCEKFLNLGTYVTGTVLANHKFLPVMMKRKLKQDECKAAHKGNLLWCRK